MSRSNKRRVAMSMALALVVVSLSYILATGDYCRFVPSMLVGGVSLWLLYTAK